MDKISFGFGAPYSPTKCRRVVFVEISIKGLEVLSCIDKQFGDSNIFEVNLTDDEALLLSDLLDKLRGNGID